MPLPLRVRQILGPLGLILIVAQVLATPALSQSEGMVVVRGTVLDDQTGQGVDGAMVRVADRQISATADRHGAFLLGGVGVGMQVLHVDALGYHSVRTVVDVSSERPLSIRLVPSPVALEGVVATGLARVEELEAALERRALETGMRVAVISRQQFAELGPMDPMDAIQLSSFVTFTDCGGAPSARSRCILRRGRRTALKVILDDQEVVNGTEVLATLAASDIHYAEVIRDCRVLRVYTVTYFEALASSKWALPPYLC